MITRIFDCLLPITKCNFECSYCYVMQSHNRTEKYADLKYTPEHIANSLTVSRLGGECLFVICGQGETLLQPEIVMITKRLLENRHYVMLTTNGTVSSVIDALISEAGDNIKRLCISFSLHYIELKRTGKLDVYFNNIKKIRKAGGSIQCNIRLCDDYIKIIDEIKERVKDELGAYPQCNIVRNVTEFPIRILTRYPYEEYVNFGKFFESPLFESAIEAFGIKRTEFCYAGLWSGQIDLSTGLLRKCYGCDIGVQNIFEGSGAIEFEPIGTNCKAAFCTNSDLFLAMGNIPEYEIKTVTELHDRMEAHWYSDEMAAALNGRLCDVHPGYTDAQQKK